MSRKLTKKEIDALAQKACLQAAAKINAHSPAVTFVEQFLTESEQIKIGRRLLIAQAILNGKTRYEINEQLQVSPNMHSRIRKWIQKEFPEYNTLAMKSKKLTSQRTNSRVEPFSYADLKRKYPAHFLFFSIAESIFKK